MGGLGRTRMRRRRPAAWAAGLLVTLAAATTSIVALSSSSPGDRRAGSRATGPNAHRNGGSPGAATTTLGPTTSAAGATTPATTTPGTTTPAAGAPGRQPGAGHHTLAATEWAAVRRLSRYGLPLYCGGRERRMVALTFDDGPGPYTHYAIAKLRAAHARATFFLVGHQVIDAPQLARRERAVAAFGDHTMTHPYLPSLRRRRALAQITQARQLIERTVHEPVLLFRPPYEAHTRAIDREVRRLRMVEVLWNVDSTDSLGGNYRQIERRVIRGLRPGSIILMHENHGQTIRALTKILAALRRRQLRAVTVPRLIAQDPPSLRQLRRGWAGCAIRSAPGNGG